MKYGMKSWYQNMSVARACNNPFTVKSQNLLECRVKKPLPLWKKNHCNECIFLTMLSGMILY